MNLPFGARPTVSAPIAARINDLPKINRSVKICIIVASLLLLAATFTASFAGEKLPAEAKSAWIPARYSKVIGYRFRIPGEDSKEAVPSGFSLLKKGSVDTALLERLAVKSVELRPEQIRKLTTAVNAKEATSPAACYDPHHIFVFYSDTGAIVAAVEICFSCTGVSAIPGIAEPRWYRHDFLALAKLTDELGLWFERRTVKEWIAFRVERDAATKKP